MHSVYNANLLGFKPGTAPRPHEAGIGDPFSPPGSIYSWKIPQTQNTTRYTDPLKFRRNLQQGNKNTTEFIGGPQSQMRSSFKNNSSSATAQATAGAASTALTTQPKSIEEMLMTPETPIIYLNPGMVKDLLDISSHNDAGAILTSIKQNVFGDGMFFLHRRCSLQKEYQTMLQTKWEECGRDMIESLHEIGIVVWIKVPHRVLGWYPKVLNWKHKMNQITFFINCADDNVYVVKRNGKVIQGRVFLNYIFLILFVK